MSSQSFKLKMTNALLTRFGRRRTLGFCTFAFVAVALAALQACGGGGSEDVDTAPAAVAPPVVVGADTVGIDADIRKKVLYAGSTKGFVASALIAAMPAGTQGDYDVLVVGDADQGGDAMVALAKEALANGKEVVFDAATDGSDTSTHAKILGQIVGTTIDSAAVHVQKAVKGYYVTPIDAPAVAATKAKAAAAHGGNVSSNSVQSVFDLPDSESAK